jgi:hypothetical protein
MWRWGMVILKRSRTYRNGSAVFTGVLLQQVTSSFFALAARSGSFLDRTLHRQVLKGRGEIEYGDNDA